ncbi:MAG: hypothetical protein AABZ39_09035 [Spirochaetota bacterium]
MQYTNINNLPGILVRALMADGYSKNSKYSMTQLIKSPQSVVLEQRHRNEITTDVSESLWRFLGSAVHDFLQKGEGASDITEERLMYLTPSGISVSGQFDCFDGEEGILYDFKVTSVYRVMHADFEDFRTQLLAYAWLLNRIGFEVKHIRNILILRDWNNSHSATAQCPLLVLDHDLGTTIEGLPISDWINTKVEAIERAAGLPNEELPECSEKFRWAQADEYKVYWNESTAKTLRSMKNFTDGTEAVEYARYMERESKGKKTFRVDLVEGNKFKRCEYCKAAPFCAQYRPAREARMMHTEAQSGVVG